MAKPPLKETVEFYVAVCQEDDCDWKSNPSPTFEDARESHDFHVSEVHSVEPTNG